MNERPPRRTWNDARAARGGGSAGFTLVEIMVVIAVIALAGQLVFMNLAALVPSTVLTSEAKRVMADIEYIRSEARLQGKAYRVDLDLDGERWRLVLPPEERLVSEQTIEESVPLDWQYLDESVEFSGHVVLGNMIQRSGISKIPIDVNGFTADQAVYLKMRSESHDDMVWTIHLRGLERKSRLITNLEGYEVPLESVEEFAFR